MADLTADPAAAPAAGPAADPAPDLAAEALVRHRLEQAAEAERAAMDGPVPAQVATVAARIVAALRAGNKVIFFGNGGSSMDAGHLAAELLGRFYRDRPPLAALSLPDATAAVTAIGNDYGYPDVFSRQLAGLGRRGDVAVGLTTSGDSENVVRALATARGLGLTTIALTGATGGRVRDVADITVAVPTDDTPRVQEVCLHLGHSVCELVERELFPGGD